MRYYSLEHQEFRRDPIPASEIRNYGMSEAELFASLDLTRPGLEAVHEAVAVEDYGPAIWAWGDYFDTAKPEVWLFDPDRYKRFMEDHLPAFTEAIRVEADALVRRTTTFFPWVPQAHTPEGEYDWFHPGPDLGRWLYGEALWSLHQLGRAFLLTGEETYAQHFQDLFNNWYESLGSIPLHYAVHAEMLIGGQRNMRLLDGLFALRGTGLLRPRTHANALKALLGTCRLQYALTPFHTGHSGWKNGQYSAACTLLTVATLFPEFREAPTWKEQAQQRLREHLFLDTYDDGGQLEVSTNYHETRLRDAFYAWYALQLNGQEEEFLTEIGPRLEKLCEFSFYTMTPTGHCLALMDGDHTEAHLVFLPLAANHFHRGDFAWLRDQFLGPGFCPTQDALPALSIQLATDRTYLPSTVPPTEPKWTSHFFPDTGVAIFRDRWARQALYASVYCGRSVPSHAHHGFGFLELWAGGRPLFGSRGSGYHSTSDHAVAYLPGCEAPYTADVRQRFWRTGAAADVVALEHDGYRQSHGTVCYRAVALVKGGTQRTGGAESEELPADPPERLSRARSALPYFIVFDDLVGPLEGLPVCWGGITLLEVERTPPGFLGRDRTQPDVGLLLQPAEPDSIVHWKCEPTTKKSPYDYPRFQAELPHLLERNVSHPQAYEQPALQLSLEMIGSPAGGSFFVLLAPFHLHPPQFEIHRLTEATKGSEENPQGDLEPLTPALSPLRIAAFAVQHAAGRDLFLFRVRIPQVGMEAEKRTALTRGGEEYLSPWACDADTVIITERGPAVAVVTSALTRLEHEGNPLLTGRRLRSLDLVLQPDHLALEVEVDRYADLILPGPFNRLFVDGVEQPEYLQEGAAPLHFYKPGPHRVQAWRAKPGETFLQHGKGK